MLSKITETLPKDTIQWCIKDSITILMDTQTFILRSFTEYMLKDGIPEEDIKTALDSLNAEKELYPTGEPYDVIFH